MMSVAEALDRLAAFRDDVARRTRQGSWDRVELFDPRFRFQGVDGDGKYVGECFASGCNFPAPSRDGYAFFGQHVRSGATFGHGSDVVVGWFPCASGTLKITAGGHAWSKEVRSGEFVYGIDGTHMIPALALFNVLGWPTVEFEHAKPEPKAARTVVPDVDHVYMIAANFDNSVRGRLRDITFAVPGGYIRGGEFVSSDRAPDDATHVMRVDGA